MQDALEKANKKASKPRKKWRGWTFRVLWMLLALLVAPVLVAEGMTLALSSGRCHESTADCPDGSVGLVLGCSKLLGKGRPNYYFQGRMEAAAELWKSGKVTHIIVSGDNSSRYYNEPRDMKNALVKLGVPADRITCDYAGLRTYDSVVRAREIFNADRLIIVSQPEHVRRAVAIARHLDIEASGLYAPLKPISLASHLKQQLRERGARIAMVYDFIICRTPKHMGEKAPITAHTSAK